MNLSACEPSSSSPGVPTTPVPQKPAPSPRYNDITRPRALRVGGDGTQQTPQPGTTHSRLWDSSVGENRQLIAGALPNQKFFRCASIASLEHPSGAVVPSPWQGTIALPGSDEETVNTAQAWIAQILDDSGMGANGGLLFLDDGLANGRVLCQVANAIAPGAVEVIHKDESDTSNVGNMRSFLIACQNFGVPAGALFDVDNRDPKRIGLCLHVLSRVVRDTVPGFSGPFLSQLDGPSPCGSGGGHSASSTDDDDASRESSTCCVDDNNDEHPHRALRPSSHSTLPTATTTTTTTNNNRSAASADKTGPSRSSGEQQHYCGKKSFSAVGGEDEEERHQQATNTATTTTTTTTASHARCAPPAHAAPSPFGHTLLWPLSPPPANGAFEAPPPPSVPAAAAASSAAAAAAAAAAQGSPEEHPAASPQRRPLSLPSRLSRTLPGGDNTLLSSVPLLSSPAANDTIWSNIFDDSQADDADGGDDAKIIDARATWAPAAKKRSGFFSSEKGGRGERKGGQVMLDALTQPAAAASSSEETLSTWLSNLNLSSFAQDLANIGVEVMGDLRYVEENDLSEIGMHGPQIRKLLQNRP